MIAINVHIQHIKKDVRKWQMQNKQKFPQQLDVMKKR